jgi:uncharacterized protein YdaU (DUF1376 family)
MHYYQFNIGDYSKDAKHLTLEEDAIYRRLIDLYYLDETPIPLDLKIVSRKILARGKEDSILDILIEFFDESESGYLHLRIEKDIAKYHSKSEKAKLSAKARWDKNANAMRTHTERNANHKPITNNHKPITKEKVKTKGRFSPPSIQDCYEYCSNQKESNKFWNHYESNGWRVGKNKMANWKASLTNWIKRSEEYNNERNQRTNTGSNRNLSAVERVKRATAIDNNAVIDITPYGHTMDQDG